MVDDDNMPAPENIPDLSINDASSSNKDIMIGWQHSGICFRKSTVSYNATPQLHFLPRDIGNLTILQLFEGLFFTTFVNSVITPQTNKHLQQKEKLTYGKFLHWLGLWFLMSTIVGPQRHEFWSTSPINAFDGAPLRLGVWMSRKCFDAILLALRFTDVKPPAFLDKFWEVQQMLEAWGSNMNRHFSPGLIHFPPYGVKVVVAMHVA